MHIYTFIYIYATINTESVGEKKLYVRIYRSNTNYLYNYTDGGLKQQTAIRLDLLYFSIRSTDSLCHEHWRAMLTDTRRGTHTT